MEIVDVDTWKGDYEAGEVEAITLESCPLAGLDKSSGEAAAFVPYLFNSTPDVM
jgi:hypothetical protein